MFVIKKQDQYGVLCLFLSTQGRKRVLFVLSLKFWVDYSNVMFFFLQGVSSLDDQVCRGREREKSKW